jgi:hypothetical protein
MAFNLTRRPLAFGTRFPALPRGHGSSHPLILQTVKRFSWLPLLLLAACRQGSHAHAVASADTASVSAMLRARRLRTQRSTLRTPLVITEPSVVVFWLPSGDSLDADSAAAAASDLEYYTDQIATTLSVNRIALVATNADTVYVDLGDHRRRAVVLSGLDYPYGYVLVDPGGPERILTGVYTDDELMDELDAYFDLPADSDTTSVTPRIIT